MWPLDVMRLPWQEVRAVYAIYQGKKDANFEWVKKMMNRKPGGKELSAEQFQCDLLKKMVLESF